MHQRLNGLPSSAAADPSPSASRVKDVGERRQDHQALVEEVLGSQEKRSRPRGGGADRDREDGGEGAGAAALGALLEHPARSTAGASACRSRAATSTADVLASVLIRGLVRDARLVRRGSQCRRLGQPRRSPPIRRGRRQHRRGAHQRVFGTASVKSTEIEVLIETRDRELPRR